MTGVNVSPARLLIRLGLQAHTLAIIIHGEQAKQGKDSLKPRFLLTLIFKSLPDSKSLKIRSMIFRMLKNCSNSAREQENQMFSSWIKATIQKIFTG